MSKCYLRSLRRKLYAIMIVFIILLSGCASAIDTSQPVSSADLSSDNSSNTNFSSDINMWKNLTCKAKLMRANKDWYGAEYESLSENSKFKTYSIDYPKAWVSPRDQYESSHPPEKDNGCRDFRINGAKVAEVFPFYIPEGMIIPNNYFELAFTEDEGENLYPQKIGDLKVGTLAGEVAKQEDIYVDDHNSTVNDEKYVYYLTDEKTIINVMFYINQDTKDYINNEIMGKVINSVKFLD